MGYEIGVTPLQMGCRRLGGANGGVLVKPAPRARAAARRHPDRSHAARTAESDRPHDGRRAGRDHGAGCRARTGPWPKCPLHGRGQDGHGQQARLRAATPQTDYTASFVGFVRRAPVRVHDSVVIDSPHAGQHYGGQVAAPISPAHCGRGAPPRGRGATINPLPPVLVQASADAASSAELVRIAAAAGPQQISVVTGAPLVPDVRGLGAREARAGSCVSASCPG